MNAEPQRTCPSCGSELSGAVEFCPVCMLRKGLAGGVEAGEPSAFNNTGKPALAQAQRFDHYELVTGDDGKPIELGRGAMGITYKAFDVDLRLPVTLKLISEKYIGDELARLRFLREARAAAKVRHSNVASVFHLGRTSQGFFYAMEFVEGETLHSLIKRSGPLEVKLALEIVMQVAAGLAAIHEQHLVHRDIKPTNIIVHLKGADRVTAKIIDLGLAKTVGGTSSESAISTSGDFAGTPEYASPEQFGALGVDIRSDLYSLGVTLWEMLTGRTPFRGSLAEVLYQHQQAPLPLELVRGFPQPVIALLEALLAKDPDLRLQDPTELLTALPKVADAVKELRTITYQSLHIFADQRLGKLGKVAKSLTKLRTYTVVDRVRLILWITLALVIGGGALLALNIFFGTNGPAPHASKRSSPAITDREKSIAVLPFESLSENRSDSYFADGIQNEILSNLAKVSQLRVISRTSVMTFRPGSNRDLRSIGTVLDVTRVLEGTVRRDGNRVRITTELIDAETDRTLWSESYDRDLTDIFAIQSEIAQTVVAILRARLSPEEKEGMKEKPTKNLQAYDLYFQAKASITSSSLNFGEPSQHFINAITLLEQATRMDPNFALAYCQIAAADDWLYSLNLEPTSKRRTHGDAAVREGLRLKPNLPETHFAAANHLCVCYHDYDGARVHIGIAERASPNSADALALGGYIDERQGLWAESTKALERACNLDPKNPEFLFELSDNYRCLHQYRDAERGLDRLIALQPDNPTWKLAKARISFDEKADMRALQATLESVPSSIKINEEMFPWAICTLIYTHEWSKARELVRSSPNEELPFGGGPFVPRTCLEIPIAKLQGENIERDTEFVAARNQLLQKVEAHPESPYFLSVLAQIDAYLGRKQEAIQEAKRTTEMLPVSKDAWNGPQLVNALAQVYALTNEPDLAFRTLEVAIKMPASEISYGELKLDPNWDSIRLDPRFDKLLAQLAPNE
jgi:serine/threonine protein kinase